MRAPRLTRWGVVAAIATLSLTAFGVVFDWNWLRGPMASYVAHKTHRAFTFSNVTIRAGRAPTVRLRNVVVGSPPWATGSLATIGTLEFSVSIAELLKGTVVLPNVEITDAEVHLERLADGRNNWSDSEPDDAAAHGPRIERLTVTRGNLAYVDRQLSSSLHIAADTVDSKKDRENDAYRTRLRFTGRYRDASFAGAAMMGDVLGAATNEVGLPVRGHLVAGSTRFDVDGTIADPMRLDAVDVDLRFSGATLANLYPFLRLPLPASPPYRIEGRLTKSGSRYDLREIHGLIGSTDISGSGTYFVRPRPLLQVDLHSQLLVLSDLGPLVGVTTKAAASVAPPTQVQTASRETAKQQEQSATGDRILPVALAADARWLPRGAFEGSRLRAIDADAELTATRIRTSDQLEAGNVHVKLHLADGVAKLQPFDLDFAGGRITSTIDVDARRQTLLARTDVNVRELQLAQLLPGSATMAQSHGQIDARFVLRGAGNSVADAAANADGRISAWLSHAEISNLLDAASGLNGAKMLQMLVGGDAVIPVRCGAASFEVADGQGRSTVFVVDTEQTRVDGEGVFDLSRERFDFVVRPQPKHASLLSFRTPVRLHGSFRRPEYHLDKKQLALRTGSSIALGIIMPIAALLPLIETGSGDDVDCQQLVSTLLAAR